MKSEKYYRRLIPAKIFAVRTLFLIADYGFINVAIKFWEELK